MIELTHVKADSDENHISDKLFASEVVKRTAGELDIMMVMLKKMEDFFLNLEKENYSSDSRETLQSIDLLQQSVSTLAIFLKCIANQYEPLEIDMGIPLTHITLGDMRKRLGAQNSI